MEKQKTNKKNIANKLYSNHLKILINMRVFISSAKADISNVALFILSIHNWFNCIFDRYYGNLIPLLWQKISQLKFTGNIVSIFHLTECIDRWCVINSYNRSRLKYHGNAYLMMQWNNNALYWLNQPKWPLVTKLFLINFKMMDHVSERFFYFKFWIHSKKNHIDLAIVQIFQWYVATWNFFG